MKMRPINKDKYGIDTNRFLEIKYHCLQYPKWRRELAELTNTIKAMQYGQEGKGSPSQASQTEHLAIKRMELCEFYEYGGKQYRNLIPLCHDCHDRVHERMKYRKVKQVNEERW